MPNYTISVNKTLTQMLKKFNNKLTPVSYIKSDICIQVGKNIKNRLLTKF